VDSAIKESISSRQYWLSQRAPTIAYQPAGSKKKPILNDEKMKKPKD